MRTHTMLGDIRSAIRTLSASRGFAVAAVLTLAIGIGANATIFTLVYGVLLKPLPYADPDRLVRLTEGRPGFSLNVSYPNFVDWRIRNRVFADMAVFNTLGNEVLVGDTGAEVVQSGTAEARLFSVMGIPAAQGRLFTAAEQQPSTPVVAVITDRLWQHRFAGDAALIGRTVRMGNGDVTVVGVLPPNVRPFNVDVWFPMRQLSPMQLDRGNHPGFAAVARLRDGIDLGAAQREMSSIAAVLEREYPASNHDMGVFVHPLLDSVAGRIRPTLLVLEGAVGLLLLIACANVANLLLARAVRRERETSIRAALGASRGRLFRLYFIEGLTLGASGCAAGLLVAGWGVRVLRNVPGLALPRVSDVSVDPHVVAFAAALTVGTVVLFALTPALQQSRIDLIRALRQGESAGPSPAGGTVRSALVAIEVALLIVLLTGAALMQRTLLRLAAVNPGFRAEGLVAAPMVQPGSRDASDATLLTFVDRLIAGMRQAPGVSGAAVCWPFDYMGFSWSPYINLSGRPFAAGREPVVQAAAVTPEYFATLGIPLLRGRNFGPPDRKGAAVGVIVNQTFVDHFFPGEDPLGRRVSGVRIPEMQDMPIIGVVGDTRRGGMLKGFVPEIYVAYAQFPQPFATLVVRAATGDPLRLGADIRAQIAAIDPSVAVTGIKRMDDQLAATYGDRHALSRLLALFAALALGLAVLGIGSVVSFSVAQRTAEIGIRLALGADRAGVVRLIIGSAMVPVLLGGAVGLVALRPLSTLIRSYVFGVSVADPASLATACAIVTVSAVAAAYVPARRAAGLDPLLAIRRP